MPFVGEQIGTNLTAIQVIGTTTRLGSINQVQRGSVAVGMGASATGTISASVLARSADTYSCANGLDNGTPGAPFSAKGVLTNTTTVTATGGTVTGANSTNASLSYVVVEYTA